MPPTPEQDLPTEEQVARFEMLTPMLKSAHDEIRELSNKKPDGMLSKAKVKWVNQLLGDARDVLGNDQSVEYLDMLDDEQLPENSDAALLLGRYLAAMTHYRQCHWRSGEWDTVERREEDKRVRAEMGYETI